jgi:hypothetical protein
MDFFGNDRLHIFTGKYLAFVLQDKFIRTRADAIVSNHGVKRRASVQLRGARQEIEIAAYWTCCQVLGS